MARKRSVKKEKVRFAKTKGDIEPFSGGCNVFLDDETRKDLVHEVDTLLTTELDNQSELIENLQKWERQYLGIKPDKVYPYEGAANVAVPMTKWLVKAILVRLIDVIFSQRKVWIVRATKPGWEDIARKLEDALDWWQRNILKFRTVIFSPLLQGIKMGTGMIKMEYIKKNRTIVDYAKPEELRDKNIKKYKTKEGAYVVKRPQTTYTGPTILPIPREDFVISSDSTTTQDAKLVGMRTYLTKNQIEVRVKNEMYDKEILERITEAGEEIDDTKKGRAENVGKIIEEFDSNKYAVWELWTKYDVDKDGEVDDIVITYHPKTKLILRCIYNPHFYGFRPFKDITPDPIEYCFDGQGAVPTLYKLQEILDMTHSQRLDRQNQINSVMLLVKEGSGLDGDTKIHPGFIKEVPDPKETIEQIQFSDIPPSSMAEEAILINYGELAVGISSKNLGQSTTERPVARETLALIEESNKARKYQVDNIREDFGEIGMMALEFFAQYQPKWEYKLEKKLGGGKSEFVDEFVDFPLEYLRDGLKVELMASSEMLNQEARREVALTEYQLVSDYYTKLASMVQAITDVSGQVPMEFKMWLIEQSKKGEKLLERVLREFGELNPEDMVESLDDSLNMKNIQNQPPQPPQEGQPGQEQGPPQGMPPNMPVRGAQ